MAIVLFYDYAVYPWVNKLFQYVYICIVFILNIDVALANVSHSLNNIRSESIRWYRWYYYNEIW